jgi:hypothetical protein
VAVLLLGVGAAACSSTAPAPSPGSSLEPDELTETQGACVVPPLATSQSLLVVDGTVLARSAFSLRHVITTILASGNASGQTATQFAAQLTDTFDTKAEGQVKNGPHCDDHVNAQGQDTVNGFPIDCPRDEYNLLSADASPVAIVNRFDLAPKNGANCGQYRIEYAAPEGDSSDHFWIFEGTLPNPDAAAGLSACAPVAQFWASLTGLDSATLGSRLQTFFFTGLPGFAPVVSAAHYGIGGGTNTGQIRTNTFKGSQGQGVATEGWQLRELRLSQTCTSPTTCTLTAEPTGVANNPYVGLFSAVAPGGQLTSFQQKFVAQLAPLVATDSPALLTAAGLTGFNAGQSSSQADDSGEDNDYTAQKVDPAFAQAIVARLAALKRPDLTVTNVLDRATSQSCAGCHAISPGRSIGGKAPAWPKSNGFTQIDEASNLSPALTQVFLPHRLEVLTKFLQSQCTDGGAASGPDDGTTLGGAVVGSAN